MKGFWQGLVAGAGGVVLIVLLVLAFRFFQERDRKIYEFMEKEYALQMLRENIDDRPAGEFLEDPGIRGSVDGAAGEFRRKRDEAVERIRSGRVDRGPDRSGGGGD
jgi:flagellar biosynthesis/type III secretory pathway M-ring protein FliF/YscJ